MGNVMIINEKSSLQEVETKEEILSLEEMQQFVHGLIETASFNRTLEQANIDLWINEEGKLDGLPITAIVVKEPGFQIVDRLAGPVLFTGQTEDGESCGLTEEQTTIVRDVIQLTRIGGKPVAILPYQE